MDGTYSLRNVTSPRPLHQRVQTRPRRGPHLLHITMEPRFDARILHQQLRRRRVRDQPGLRLAEDAMSDGVTKDACQRSHSDSRRLRERDKRRSAVQRHSMREVEARDELEIDDLVVLERGLGVR